MLYSIRKLGASCLVVVAMGCAPGEDGALDGDEDGSGSDDGDDSGVDGGDAGEDDGGDDSGADGGDDGGIDDEFLSDYFGRRPAGEWILAEPAFEVVEQVGNYLYSASQYAGLRVTDMTSPANPIPQSSAQLDGDPVAMFFEQGDGLTLLISRRPEVVLDGLHRSVRSSAVVARYDIEDPAAAALDVELMVRGELIGGHRVDDILYIVTHDSRECSACGEQGPEFVVTSVALEGGSGPQIIEEVVSSSSEAVVGSGMPWHASDSYLYWVSEQHTLHVADVSAGDGTIVLGGSVELAGEISKSEQLDEHEGVLRVLADLGLGGIEVSAYSLGPGPQLDLVASDAHGGLGQLGRVVMDQERGFVEGADGVVALSLADPGQPSFLDFLSGASAVGFMRLIGDRLFRVENDVMAMIDVSDLSNLQRVSEAGIGEIGGFSGSDKYPHRIDHSISFSESEGLVAVSVAGYSQPAETTAPSRVELLGWSGDTLSQRGHATVRGLARLPLLADGTLTVLSDLELVSFDISDRDNPQTVAVLEYAETADIVVPAAGSWARMAYAWNDGFRSVGVSSEPDAEVATQTIDALPVPEGVVDRRFHEAVFYHGEHLFVIEAFVPPFEAIRPIRIASIDLSNPGELELDGELLFDGLQRGYGTGTSTVDDPWDWWAVEGDRLVLLLQEEGESWESPKHVVIVDISDPSDLVVSGEILESGQSGTGALLVVDGEIYGRGLVPVAGRTRHYLHRLDLSGAPQWASRANVPGLPLIYHPPSQEVLGIESEMDDAESGELDCLRNPLAARIWDQDGGVCTYMERTFVRSRLEDDGVVELERVEVEEEGGLRRIYIDAQRVYARFDPIPASGQSVSPETSRLLVGELEGAKLELHELSGAQFGPDWDVRGHLGTSALIQGVSGPAYLVDSSDAANSQVTASQPPTRRCWSPLFADGQVYCVMGRHGVERLEW